MISAAAAAEDAMALNPLRASVARSDLRFVVLTDQGPHVMLRTAARLRAGSGEQLLETVAQARSWFADYAVMQALTQQMEDRPEPHRLALADRLPAMWAEVRTNAPRAAGSSR